jgi:hypothetical protein
MKQTDYLLVNESKTDKNGSERAFYISQKYKMFNFKMQSDIAIQYGANYESPVGFRFPKALSCSRW